MELARSAGGLPWARDPGISPQLLHALGQRQWLMPGPRDANPQHRAARWQSTSVKGAADTAACAQGQGQSSGQERVDLRSH